MRSFELALTLPPAVHLNGMVRDLVVQGARCAGCAEREALEFGCQVEDAVRDLRLATGATASICIVVRRTSGPIEVILDAGGGTRVLALPA